MEKTWTSPEDLDIESKPWWTLILPVVIGPILLFGGTRVASESWPLAFAEFMIAMAACSVGGFLGFLFGIPRSTIAEGDPASGAEKLTYRPSTNLEQVSDWLTKLLIGVGLVEIRSIGAALSELGTFVQASVAPDFSAANIITQAAVVSFMILAFLATFLWTRIQYGPLQMRIDKDALSGLSKKFDQIESELEVQKADTEKAVKITGMIARGELATAPPSAVQNEVLEADIASDIASWPDDVQAKYRMFREAPRNWDSDPSQTLFKVTETEKDGLILTADVIESLPDVLIIKLTVGATSTVEFKGMVTYLLHPTLAVPIQHVPVVNNRADVIFPTQGWFTVVAIANSGRTILSLDLRKISGLPKWFLED